MNKILNCSDLLISRTLKAKVQQQKKLISYKNKQYMQKELVA